MLLSPNSPVDGIIKYDPRSSSVDDIFSMTRETVLLDLLLHCHNEKTFSFRSTIGIYNPFSVYVPKAL